MDNGYQHAVEQWWLALTAGLIYLALGAWVLFFPITSYLALTTFFIIGFGMIGMLNVYYALNNRKKLQHWGWTLMSGLADVLITFLLIANSELTLFILPIYIGFVLLFRSIIGIGFASYLSHYHVRNWGLVLALSIIGVLFSMLLIWRPSIGRWTIVAFTGLALLSNGFAQIGIAYELKRYRERFGQSELA